MAQQIYMPEDMQHASWRGEAPDVVRASGFQFTDLDFGCWTVKLEFQIKGRVATGSGFFINIPDCAKAVILTAGHNLLSSDGTRSAELTVLGESEADKYRVPEGDIYVARAFTGAHGKPGVDWGVVLYPRERLGSVKKGFGFGFGYSLRLAYAQHIGGTVYVSGYRSTTEPGHPDTSSGTLVAAYQEWLEYRLTTEQGLSGSVVWTAYGGCPTVIAIHNHSPDPTRKNRGAGPAGSRGARLNAAMLHEILDFAQVGHYGVRLRAHGTPKQILQLPGRGLYLSFPEGFSFARVRLGPGSAVDIVPAETQKSSKQYAMVVEGRWALFNTAKQQVVLSEIVREECLFSMEEKLIKSTGGTEISVIIARDGKKWMLRIRGERLKHFEDEEDDEGAESSEVSLLPYPSKDTYVRFALESGV